MNLVSMVGFGKGGESM